MKTASTSTWATAATVVAVHPVGEAMDDDRPSIELSETNMQHETDSRNADRGWIDGALLD